MVLPVDCPRGEVFESIESRCANDRSVGLGAELQRPAVHTNRLPMNSLPDQTRGASRDHDQIARFVRDCQSWHRLVFSIDLQNHHILPI
jgi:hypothetical protein